MWIRRGHDRGYGPLAAMLRGLPRTQDFKFLHSTPGPEEVGLLARLDTIERFESGPHIKFMSLDAHSYADFTANSWEKYYKDSR